MATTSKDDLWIHDETDRVKAGILARFYEDPGLQGNLPRPFGVFYSEKRACYETLLIDQISRAKELFGDGDLDELLTGKNTWTIA